MSSQLIHSTSAMSTEDLISFSNLWPKFKGLMQEKGASFSIHGSHSMDDFILQELNSRFEGSGFKVIRDVPEEAKMATPEYREVVPSDYDE
jgi:hypothetical protein